MLTETLIGLCVGVGLAASCGLRVFVPLLVVGVASQLGVVQLGETFAWMGSWAAVVSFGLATVLEVTASSWPWLDHVLDAAAAPLALVAGAVLMAAQLEHLHPALAWGAGVVAGGGAAGAVQATSTGARGVSTASTGGLLNPVLNAGQSALAGVLSVLAVVAPVVAAAAVMVGVWVVWRVVRRVRARRRARTLGDDSPVARRDAGRGGARVAGEFPGDRGNPEGLEQQVRTG